jgi:hypothetical protein
MALESQAINDKIKADELADTNIALDNKIAELNIELIADRAASTSMQKTLEKSVVENVLLGGQVVEISASLPKFLEKAIVEQIPLNDQTVQLNNPCEEYLISRQIAEDCSEIIENRSYDISFKREESLENVPSDLNSLLVETEEMPEISDGIRSAAFDYNAAMEYQTKAESNELAERKLALDNRVIELEKELIAEFLLLVNNKLDTFEK